MRAQVRLADLQGGGVKALHRAAQEWRHLLDGTIYPQVKLVPHLDTASPCCERASTAPSLYDLVLAPPPSPPCVHKCPLLHVSRSPRLRSPLSAHFARTT
jgi:hypothetical protein